MSEKIIFLLILAVFIPLGCFAQYAIPKRPTTRLPKMNSQFWSAPSNWPMSITNGNLHYTRVIRLSDKTLRRPNTVAEAKASGVSFAVHYNIESKHIWKDAKYKPKEEWEISYGPCFSWRTDGTIRIRGFYYTNGFEEIHYLTPNGKTIKSMYTDHASNTSTWVAYDDDTSIVCYAHGPENEDKAHEKKSVYIIHGKEIADECEFYRFFGSYRKDDINPQRE